MKNKATKLHLFLIMGVLVSVNCLENNFASHFADCHRNRENFDSCIKEALNACRIYFKTGLSQYGIDPFDPFYVKEVVQKIGESNLNYELLLKNVYESGWIISEVTKFKSDFNNNVIKYQQLFPDKKLNGDYEITLNVLGFETKNKGTWNLTLYDFSQTTTVTREPRKTSNGTVVYDTPITVNVKIKSCENLKLHVTDFSKNRTDFDNLLDEIMNNYFIWKPAFFIVRPLVNDLVSTAFTEIFTKNFQNFPFNEIVE